MYGLHGRSKLPESWQQQNFLNQRGGGGVVDQDSDAKEEDSERYSRQLYVLGARAQGLIRQSCIVVDGPAESGLLWECVKNLALSGVGSIIILEDNSHDEKSECKYHYTQFDDLGQVYTSAAKTELERDESESDSTPTRLLRGFITRLNPSVRVSTMSQQQFEGLSQDVPSQDDNLIFLCVDRSQSHQMEFSKTCRLKKSSTIQFISVETAGLYGRIFCDLGSDFTVVDPDGETPKPTLLDRIEVNDINNALPQWIVHCVDGERHDASKGDIIQFQWKTKMSLREVDRSSSTEEITSALQMRIVKVHSPTKLTAEFVQPDMAITEDRVSYINKFADTFSRVKIAYDLHFLPLDQALEAFQNDTDVGPLFTMSDLDKSFDDTRRQAIMHCFSALDKFVHQKGSLPFRRGERGDGSCGRNSDLEQFLSLAQECGHPKTAGSGDRETHARNFFNTCAGKFTPIQAFLGGIAAQEVLKACSGLYQPIQQFLLYDVDEVLEVAASLKSKVNIANDFDINKYSGQRYVIGEELSKRLLSSRIFVVGAGAIGCEILKNLAAMTRSNNEKTHSGKITITDMDTIERSNLSRQLLFRDSDIGKFKSMAAEEALMRFNPQMRVEAHTSKVGDDSASSTPFNEKFWSKKVQVVMNALDNVPARLYMDAKCVEFGLAMIDAGTLGSKGNVQVVVPHQSESYGSSADPPEEEIPVCTLKNFPYEISHTIQWARDLFDGIFNQRATQLKTHLKPLLSNSVAAFADDLVQQVGEDSAFSILRELSEDLRMVVSFNDKVKDAVADEDVVLEELSMEWAIRLFEDNLQAKIRALLKEHPADSLNEDGQHFWSGARRMPKELNFQFSDDNPLEAEMNEWIIKFIQYASRLRAEMHASLLKSPSGPARSEPSADTVRAALVRRSNTEYQRASQVVEEGEQELHLLVKDIDYILDGIKTQGPIPDKVIESVEFEKDDENNGHVAFVTAASNLRALAYGIPTASAVETRRVSGNIVPAMITTTAVVSALSCLELTKSLASKKSNTNLIPLHLYRNAFINLAQPFFAFIAPLPAKRVAVINDKTYTLWDRISIQEGSKTVEKHGGITLGQLKKKIKNKIDGCGDVASITLGPFLIYANFLHDFGDSASTMKKTVIWDLVECALTTSGEEEGEDFGGRDEGDASVENTEQWLREAREKSYLDLTVVVEDESTGEEIELPPVRILKYRGN
jgi:ubiquitin-activating enzyme E1